MNNEPDAERLVDAAALSFITYTVTLAPGCELRYDDADWRDAIVFVTDGEIELHCCSGTVRRFRRGHILWLANLPLKAVRNPSRVPARLVALSRRI
jgi:glyoxylate utilization-related uncharacterized protein